MEVKIIFEDQDLLVLDKPAGIIVNKSDTTKRERTMQDFVEEYFKITNPKSQIPNKSEISNSNNQTNSDFGNPDLIFKRRAGIVHRLDKETSGIILVAKTHQAFINLQTQFKERKVKKTYIALVHGKVEPTEGEIRASVGRLPWNRKRFGVLSGGRESVTRYRVITNYKLLITKSQEDLSLLELHPKTGRTHQIRVHLQYIHHPIFADPLYAGRKTGRNDRKLLSRVFLHAFKISFSHPATGKTMTFESPLPEDLSIFLDSLKP